MNRRERSPGDVRKPPAHGLEVRMDNWDANTFGQFVVRLNLITEAQLREAMDELPEGSTDMSALIRVLERRMWLTPWQIDRLFKEHTDGYILGGYRILYKVKGGTFGRVYRGDDPRTGRVVAIKILRRRWSEDPKQVDLFFREGKLGLTLKHPNIVEILNVGQDPASEQYYIVMEFVEGGNLREILDIRGKLSPAESLKIMEDAASGLAYAYAHGITHRDIKLTNLLISTTGECKLVDFGLAQLFANEKEKIDRTVDYAGLERATGVKQGDTRTDIYFLGCIMYQCLTGRPPLQMVRDRHARMRKSRFEAVVPIRPFEVDAPPSTLSLVETMMSLSAKNRYQTPAQLLEAVKAARRDIEGTSGKVESDRPVVRSVYVIEGNARLQQALRERLRDLNYRVFIAADPAQALDRFQKQPYDALIVDVASTGEDGLYMYESVAREAARKQLPMAGIVLLAEEQKDWKQRASAPASSAVFTHPVTFRQLKHALEDLLPKNGQPPTP
jgi:serine/threonine protein kinase